MRHEAGCSVVLAFIILCMVMEKKIRNQQKYIYYIIRHAAGCSVVLGFIILCMVMVADADKSPSQCKQENNILISACKPVFMGQKASAYCCQRFRIMHFECCPLVTPKLTNLINVQHTIQQIRACGKRVPHNFKCGSITSIEDSGRSYQNQYI